jgi:Na+(H+)/acetate symporter ActP
MQLSAPDAADRVWACAAVSNLIQNDPSTRRLLQGKNIVGALVQRLTDSTEDVVVEAAGALRSVRAIGFPLVSKFGLALALAAVDADELLLGIQESLYRWRIRSLC